ncbi:MAG: ABC transporter permease subunit [Streptosporangiales bacterium]|nr:ABC transporter permease subunit [Streptosporangiales bacterium]
MIIDPILRGPRGRGGLRRLLPPVLLAVLLVAGWTIAAAALNSSVFPGPGQTVDRLLLNLDATRFQESTADTLLRLSVSWLLVVAVGGAIGFLIGLSRFWTDVFSPVVYAVYSIPKIVLFPLFLVFLGLGEASQIGFAFFSGVIPMVLMTLNATAGTPLAPLKLAASLRMGTWPVVRTVVLPAALPAIATALRLTFGLTFLGLIIAEMFTGVSGLGYELLRNVVLAQMEDIVGGVLLIALIAVAPTTLLRVLEMRVARRFGGGDV